jgi:methionyl-tRNA formyltransferase
MAVRILFMGTPAFAVPSLLRLLASGHEVVGVVTQPDRPRGRGRHVVPEAVKTAAIERGLNVLQPTRLADEATLATLRDLEPDLAIVAAYGRLLPQALLDLPRLGVINVHASLLPRWRGAAPVHRAIVAGDAETGVTIMRVVLALDAGPMLARVATPIGSNETSAELESRLATLGAGMLPAVVSQLSAGTVLEEAQDQKAVTYAKKLERADSRIDWTRPAVAVHNQIRGLQPWPLAAAVLNGRRLALLRSTVVDDRILSGSPGSVIQVEKDALVVAAEPGAIRLLELREADRSAMSVAAYLNGRRVAVGDRFEAEPAPTS